MGFGGPLVRSVKRLKKALPGQVTDVAKFNNPNNDLSSVKVTFFFLTKYCNFSRIFSTFSFGSLHSIATESISIPYIVMTVDGSTVFSCFIGTPISEHKEINCDKS